MRAVIQRVESAAVSVDGSVVGRISGGFLVLLGIGSDDTERDCEKLSRKMIDLRIFADDEGKTNLSLKDVGGELLIISQFTLYADCHKGNRPNFLKAKEPAEAQRLYELFCELCGREVPIVERGIFGAEMRVELVNDGPFTIVLECNDCEISS
ncbi:MAG: D-tyrosyl-tRNA(Tyr) deacylase [Oscillospiraceae bacterium]|nr:D-tyrosyl-tRNA(Tyr) deacylase [Oscillospiraceae bacterium]